jgi:alkanesulfonate monooxygenase SsuD/methylene tetrahydromethanopterin reductase-like flavin-dependent oxidoreductase (luciferase family)
VWSVEHHFDAYSMCPTTRNSWLAGRTSRIGLGTAAVILPWNNRFASSRNDPARPPSNGRAVFGMGRGLAKMEYRGMMIDMNEARERSTGGEDDPRRLESARRRNGPFYKQARTNVPADAQLQGSYVLRGDVSGFWLVAAELARS